LGSKSEAEGGAGEDRESFGGARRWHGAAIAAVRSAPATWRRVRRQHTCGLAIAKRDLETETIFALALVLVLVLVLLLLVLDLVLYMVYL
jgi:uncharacterized membrane protein YidH (DUF202 family)